MVMEVGDKWAETHHDIQPISVAGEPWEITIPGRFASATTALSASCMAACTCARSKNKATAWRHRQHHEPLAAGHTRPLGML